MQNKLALTIASLALLVSAGANFGAYSVQQDEINTINRERLDRCDRFNESNSVVRNILLAGLVTTPAQEKKLTTAQNRDLQSILKKLHKGDGHISTAERNRLVVLAVKINGGTYKQVGDAIDAELVGVVKLAPIKC